MHLGLEAKAEISAAEIPWCCVVQQMLTFFVAVICVYSK